MSMKEYNTRLNEYLNVMGKGKYDSEILGDKRRSGKTTKALLSILCTAGKNDNVVFTGATQVSVEFNRIRFLEILKMLEIPHEIEHPKGCITYNAMGDHNAPVRVYFIGQDRLADEERRGKFRGMTYKTFYDNYRRSLTKGELWD